MESLAGPFTIECDQVMCTSKAYQFNGIESVVIGKKRGATESCGDLIACSEPRCDGPAATG